MNKKLKNILLKNSDMYNVLLSILAAFVIGGVVILIVGENPFATYGQLFKGAFNGKLSFGTTLEKFVPLLLTALAFAISSKVSVFNVGVEGELYLGAMASAIVGFSLTGIPKPLHILFCFLAAIIAGGLWALIPAFLKAYYKVNEVCTTILLNYVAMYLTSYLVNNPFASGTGIPKTVDIESSAVLSKIMLPSRANTGLFVAIGIYILICWYLYKTKGGFKLRNVGSNPDFSEYIGIEPKKNMLKGMFISGSVGGIAGAITVMGTFGYFLDNFSPGIAFDGMLAALIAKNNPKLIPVMAFFLAVLKSGTLGMERFTGIEKSLIDAIIATFILIATMEGLFKLKKRTNKKLTNTEM